MSIPKGEYNGWRNWATWNVALWLGNDEGIYHAAVELAKAKQKDKIGKVTAMAARHFVLNVFPDGTPNMRQIQGRKYSDVDFKAIADAINEFIE